MKKNLNLFTLPLVFLAALTMLGASSCTEGEENTPKKPDVEVVQQGIAISVAVDSAASYANIFRKVVEPVLPEDEAVHNIGMIIPSAKDFQESYAFVDYYIVGGKKYSYCIRYRHEDGYVYTGWTDWPVDEDKNDVAPPTSPYTDDSALTFAVPSDTFFEYNPKFRTLTVKGSSVPSVTGFEDFIPSICVSNTKKTRVFELEDAAAGSSFTTGTKIDLRTTLTSDFFDTEIKIDGIIYQKTDRTKPSYQKITWSQPSGLPVKDMEGNDITSLKIPLTENTDDFHDFSDMEEKLANRGVKTSTENILENTLLHANDFLAYDEIR